MFCSSFIVLYIHRNCMAYQGQVFVLTISLVLQSPWKTTPPPPTTPTLCTKTLNTGKCMHRLLKDNLQRWCWYAPGQV